MAEPNESTAAHIQQAATQAATVAATAAGTAAGTAAATVNEAGSMGLKGMFSVVGNTTAMVVVTVFMFMLYRDGRITQAAETQHLRQEVEKTQEWIVKEALANRTAYTEQHSNIFNAIHQLEQKADQHNTELAALVRELRKSGSVPKSDATKPTP